MTTEEMVEILKIVDDACMFSEHTLYCDVRYKLKEKFPEVDWDAVNVVTEDE
jgi:hypothetical protein